MARIERRQAHLRRLRQRRPGNVEEICDQGTAQGADTHHHIGMSQNEFEHIGTFLQRNSGDPAIKVITWECYKPLQVLTPCVFFPPPFRISFPNSNHTSFHASRAH